MSWKELESNWWGGGSEFRIGTRKTIEHGHWLDWFFRTADVYVNPSCRLVLSRAMIEGVQRGDASSATSYELVEAQRTINEFYFIGRTLVTYPKCFDELAVTKLRQALGGNVVDLADKNHHARNTQAELFHFCAFMRADLDPILAEPDIQLRFAGTRYGIAVKRMNTASVRKMRRRLREGIDQISRTKIPGFVCFDVDVALRSISEPHEHSGAAERGQEFDDMIDHMYDFHLNLPPMPHYCGAFFVGFTRSHECAADVHTAAYFQKFAIYPHVIPELAMRELFEERLQRGYGTFLALCSQ